MPSRHSCAALCLAAAIPGSEVHSMHIALLVDNARYRLSRDQGSFASLARTRPGDACSGVYYALETQNRGQSKRPVADWTWLGPRTKCRGPEAKVRLVRNRMTGGGVYSRRTFILTSVVPEARFAHRRAIAWVTQYFTLQQDSFSIYMVDLKMERGESDSWCRPSEHSLIRNPDANS